MKSGITQKLAQLVAILLFPGFLMAQTSFQKVVFPEYNILPQDEGTKQKKDKKRKDEFKVFAGINLNKINIESSKYQTTIAPGFLLGASYKRGKFFYWEVGARYNNPVNNLDDKTIPADSSALLDGIFSIRNVDIPITFGINFLSITSRIVGLRIFISGVPAFVVGVGKNELEITTDKLNIFNFYGQAGVGIDVAFIFIELGVNYGFQDQFINHSPSNPYQGFFNLGFRF